VVTRIVLIRHGAVDADGRCYGQRLDPRLSEAGQLEAAALRRRLADWPPRHAERSPATRTAQTAARLGLTDPRVDPRWAERDLGEWEGRPWSQLWEQAPADVLSSPSAYAAFTPPGGEPTTALRQRVVTALEELAARFAPPDGDAAVLTTPPVAVVTHGGPIVCAVAHALDLDDATALRLRVRTATATWLTRWSDGSWTVDAVAA
jgi:broad specificity phosphatase PhoE